MKLIQFKEQIAEGTHLSHDYLQDLIPYIADGQKVLFTVNRGYNPKELCLSLIRNGNEIIASGAYFIGIDWLAQGELAIQVSPKMNNGFEVDYVRMLNDALSEPENYNYLNDLVTIHFNEPSIKVQQQQDLLSIFLITEYINILERIVNKGLKKGFYMLEENLHNKIKGRILIGHTISNNVVKGRITDNVCKYQTYGIDTPENRILKIALRFCAKQVQVYNHLFNTNILAKKIKFIKPYFHNISDETCIKKIKYYKGNPIYKEYSQALEFAQLILNRYSYDITAIGKKEISTPPFWIDMSKLFELYVFHHLRQVFTSKNEIRYHIHAHYQELDYLLSPELWPNPYVIDAKYKPQYKNCPGISKNDAREVAGYARLSKVYELLGLNEETEPPIKCLIIYPDQDEEEYFKFNRETEPLFERIKGYARFYKLGIRLPVIPH